MKGVKENGDNVQGHLETAPGKKYDAIVNNTRGLVEMGLGDLPRAGEKGFGDPKFYPARVVQTPARRYLNG